MRTAKNSVTAFMLAWSCHVNTQGLSVDLKTKMSPISRCWSNLKSRDLFSYDPRQNISTMLNAFLLYHPLRSLHILKSKTLYFLAITLFNIGSLTTARKNYFKHSTKRLNTINKWLWLFSVLWLPYIIFHHQMESFTFSFGCTASTAQKLVKIGKLI